MELNDSTASFMVRMDRACTESFFTCRGISSHVIGSDGSIGHVLMLDIEDKKLVDVLNWCDNNLGNYAVFKSSSNSYHVLNPKVRSYEKTYEFLKNISLEDSNHADIGYERGDWVLRISDKPDKPMPELIEYSLSMDKKNSYSKPHIKYINALHSNELANEWFKLPLVGETLRTVQYWTFK